MPSAHPNGLTAATQQDSFDPIIQEFVSEFRPEGVADSYCPARPVLVRRSLKPNHHRSLRAHTFTALQAARCVH